MSFNSPYELKPFDEKILTARELELLNRLRVEPVHDMGGFKGVFVIEDGAETKAMIEKIKQHKMIMGQLKGIISTEGMTVVREEEGGKQVPVKDGYACMFGNGDAKILGITCDKNKSAARG